MVPWLHALGGQLLRFAHVATAWTGVALLVAGVLIGHRVFGDLSIGDLLGYLEHGKASDPQRVGERLVPVMDGGGFVWSYGLILFGFALLYLCGACSRLGRRLAGFAVMAVAVTVVADLVGRHLRSRP
jgi:hypothetical protein